MEKRKVAKALPFACHFSLTGTVRFFCCFFDKRDHPLSSHQSLNIWINFSQFLRGSSPNENRGSWPQPPVLARTPSSVVVWFLNSRKRVIWLESHFWHMLEKRKHYESRSGRHIYSTPPMLGQSISNWGHNTLSVPKNEVRAGHELRKTLSFKEQIMFKGKYTSVLLGQTGILCSLYLGHFLKCVQ